MRLRRRRGAHGFFLVEALLATALIAVLAFAAVPGAARLYRIALVEYETQCLLSDLRYVQRLARTTMERSARAQTIGARGVPELRVDFDGTSYRIIAVRGRSGQQTVRTHRLPAGVAVRLDSNAQGSGSAASVRFDHNGRVYGGAADLAGVVTSAGYTFQIYPVGDLRSGNRIRIDFAGRIRIERIWGI